MQSTVLLLFVIGIVRSARITVSRGNNASKIEDLCARMHNNTAMEGTDPLEFMQATAYECQKKCVDAYPSCSAVVYYYLHKEKKHHFCYLFEHNSVHGKVSLVEQKPEHKKDLVRMLEIVSDCHLFDAHPPLMEDGLVSSTDKVDRKKRQNNDEETVLGTTEWTDWSHCSTNGHEVRSQTCEYGRKIQRRGCPARQAPQRVPVPPAPLPYSQQQPQQLPQRPNVSPYDQYAQLYRERMSQQRTNQRHPAISQAQPCEGGVCIDPRQRQPQRPQPPQLESTYPPSPSIYPTRYRPAAPPPPVCNGTGCIAPRTPVGVWHDWSEWSDCSCTCDTGMKQRRRECATNNCQGPEFEQDQCNLGPCQTWSDWCEWSACAGSCGRGEKTRTRFCHLGTQRCDGKDFEIESCDAGPCPEWTEWEDWSQCSASCGPGISVRQRTCLGGIHGDHLCLGPKSEQRVCEVGPCSQWAPWQEWGQCSTSCGNGMKRRQRVCQYGTDCAGPAEETMFCYGRPCDEWTEWCEWSHCSSKCGPGQRTRTRGCLTSEGREGHSCQGLSIETTLCEGMQCCRWSDWCHWSMCDKECGGGQSMRTRSCMRDGGGADDSCHCDGPDRESRDCNTQSCTSQCAWTEWCSWSDCTTPNECEVGIQNRSRQCVGEPGCHCLGMAEESQQCRGKNPCPQKPPC